MSESPADRLRRVRIARGYASAADAARAYGWPVVTYTSHENGTRGIRKDAAQRYAQAFGIPINELLDIGAPASASQVPVIGGAAMGLWRDSSIDRERSSLTRSVPILASDGYHMQFALEVLDDSVNRLIANGEFAICVPINEDTGSELKVGSLVVVERIRGSLKEKSIRRIKSQGERMELQTFSTEPRFSETIECPSARDDETVNIVGKVVGKHVLL